MATEPYVRQELVAKANNHDAGAQEKLAHAGLHGVRAWATEQDVQRKTQEAAKFRPPSNQEVAAYFTKTDPATGQKFIDYLEMWRAIDFAQRRGYPDITAARQDYQAWRREVNSWTRARVDDFLEGNNFAPSNKLGAAGAQNLPPVTPYDRKAGALPARGTLGFGQHTDLLEQQAQKIGLVLRRGSSGQERLRAQQTLQALYERGVIPRDHLQVLWEYYVGAQKAAPKKK